MGSACRRPLSGSARTSNVAVSGSSPKRHGWVLWIEGAATAAETQVSTSAAPNVVLSMRPSSHGGVGRLVLSYEHGRPASPSAGAKVLGEAPGGPRGPLG